MNRIKTNVTTKTTVDSFEIELTPLQMQYVTAVLGATVVSSTIPKECQGMYDRFLNALADARLVNREWVGVDVGKTVDEDGVPYALNLFRHLGLRGPLD